ncbi:MAG: hypothetical protein GAK31_01949 [Stenotrophomonas maltophilia]|uniref:Low-complexity protein n=1 Tax=Stenotrophomonas maltophilia TaxID=40324 RepID=A0A7V8JMX1_STEMA|nr:MAG: hypothetical protein GAK31_01949 [Stenotrophomonas maltophilia]
MSATTKSLPLLAATALVAGLGLSAGASALSMTDLAQGYMVAGQAAAMTDGKAPAKHAEGKCGADGKSAEGKCGADKGKAKAAAPKPMAGGKKAAEGKCGEGKCGAKH